MKKIYSYGWVKAVGVMALSAVVALSADAQTRKTWDFTQGFSEETIANLVADKNWSANHTLDGVEDRWQNANANVGIPTANGQVIAELEGIEFLSTAQKKGNDLHIYQDRKNIRINRKGMKFKLPKVTGGQTITIKAKSANATATTRGIQGDNNVDYIDGPEGGICLGSDLTGYGDYYTLVWKVKEEVTDSVQITFTMDPDGGLDVCLFQIDNGDGPGLDAIRNVLFVTNDVNSDYQDEALNAIRQSSDKFVVNAIQSTDATYTVDSLYNYDAVVVSPWIGAEDALVPVLRQGIAMVPMLNLNASVLPAWGFSAVALSGTNALNVLDNEVAATLFEGLPVVEGKMEILSSEGNLSALGLDPYFAADDTIATVGDNFLAVHMHKPSRNAYMALPLTQAAAALIVENSYMSFVVNATAIVARTKSKKVESANKPTVSQSYQDKVTEVKLSSSNSDAIYYTLNGDEPTAESTLYTAPFQLNDSITVKAIAFRDGYLPSAIASTKITIKTQLADPVITLDEGETSTTVTLSCPDEGATLYFSFSGITNSGDAERYDKTKPIVLTQEPGLINVFAEADGYVNSNNVKRYIPIKSLNSNTIRLDTVSHFSANQKYWIPATEDNYVTETVVGTGNASAYYYLDESKKGWNYYSEEILGYEEKEVVGDDGETTKEQVPVYAPANDIRYVTSTGEPDWRIYSSGQVIVSQNVDPSNAVGFNNANYRADSALDLIGGKPTKFDVQFGAAKNASDPYSAGVESVVKFTAPFDVVVYLGTGTANSNAVVALQTSTDGEKWATVDTLAISQDVRGVKKNRIAVDEAGDYFVRVAQLSGSQKPMIFDIYVLNNGDFSKAYNAEDLTGIESVIAPEAAEVVAVEVYNINGIRLAEPQTGLNIIRTVYADGTSKVIKLIKR